MKAAVGGLTFEFPDDWHHTQYDGWSFYRHRFGRMWNEIKAVDLLVLDPSATLWFLEVKDYRQHRRTKSAALHTEVAEKVFDTLAALLPARCNGDDSREREFAKAALQAKRLRVVLHLEQPHQHSKLFPRAIEPSVVQLALRRVLKPIDAHAVVSEKRNLRALSWSVI
ncbi:MAG: hypothetical protein HY791_06365 [Deltaproteobacteria bacterium]|nr:hypothetical protein [Deltaproteobacteria bacterium]